MRIEKKSASDIVYIANHFLSALIFKGGGVCANT